MPVSRGEPRPEKAATVDEIRGQLEAAESALLVEMHGLSVAEATDLRSQFRQADVRLKVYKNTLLTIAVSDLGIEGLADHLVGPTAIASSTTDPSAAMKVLRAFMKTNEKVRVKAAVVGVDVLDASDAASLADLPTYEQGVALLAGVLPAPVTGLARALNSLVAGLAVSLGRVVEMREQGAAAE